MVLVVVIVNIISASTGIAILFNHNWKNSSCLSQLPHGIGGLYKKLKKYYVRVRRRDVLFHSWSLQFFDSDFEKSDCFVSRDAHCIRGTEMSLFRDTDSFPIIKEFGFSKRSRK